MKNPRILFIVNPIAGNHTKEHFRQKVRDRFPEKHYSWKVVYSSHPGHATELASGAVEEGFDAVVGVGGDGTFNEIARGLMHQPVAVGIIPSGSGNGIAHYLGMPVNVDEALEVIRQHRTTEIDVGKVNGTPFYATAGVGFDARVGDLFARQEVRGFWSYARLAVKEFFSYEGQTYYLDGKVHDDVLMATFANIDQYGNDFFIAPGADAGDGLLEVVVMKKFPYSRLPEVLWQLKNGKIEQSPFYSRYQCTSVTLERDSEGAVQVDGEPRQMDKNITVNLDPLALKVIAADS